jgi:hypothetical protein
VVCPPQAVNTDNVCLHKAFIPEINGTPLLIKFLHTAGNGLVTDSPKKEKIQKGEEREKEAGKEEAEWKIIRLEIQSSNHFHQVNHFAVCSLVFISPLDLVFSRRDL